MNIFGEGFPDEIINQIKYRQEVYGSGYTSNRTPQDIAYLNSKTGFCRLVSGVDISSSNDINNPTIKGLGLSGPDLAKKFVLSNGTSEYISGDDTYSLNQRAGVATQSNIYGQSAAYGIGGTDFGLNPMMGIISADIKHENRGSLRRAVVKVKAFNKNQFEIIDTLYMRLGFSVLLEWGHSMWLNDKGDLVTNEDNSLIQPFLDAYGEKQIVKTTTNGGWSGTGGTWDDASDTSNFNNIYNQALNNANKQFAAQDATATTGFQQQVAAQQEKNGDITPPPTVTTTITEGKGNLTYDDILQLIYKKRLSSSGNYDAMLAKVANFSWTLNIDGSYDITIYLSSIGDVIESLKVNMLTTSVGKNNTENNITQTNNTSSSSDVIDSFAYNSTISNFLFQCKKFIDPINDENNKSKVYTLSLSNKSFDSFDSNIFDLGQDDIMRVDLASAKSFNWGGLFTGNFFSQNYDKMYYIRLGSFLRFLKSYIIPKVYTKKNDNGQILQIDDDTNTNIMLSHPFQISTDLRICFVNKSVLFGITDYSKGTTTNSYYVYGAINTRNPFVNTELTDIVKKPYEINYGNIMNIYLEFGFILKKIVELRDDQGNLPLIDFLKALLKGINEGLGGINDLDVFIDETNNQIKIIDKNPLPYENKIIDHLNQKYTSNVLRYNNFRLLNNKYAEFQLYGYSNSQAGFIDNFSLTTELSPQFSTMITVGAAARGSVVGENETALSRLNYGFEDRFKHTMSNSPSLQGSTTLNDDADYNNRKAELDKIKKDYFQFMQNVSNGPESNLRAINAQAKDLDSNKVNLSSLLQKANEVDKLKNYIYGKKTTLNYNGAGFIPFNLGLTMDGLSGTKINQQFLINTDFLPTNYPTTMKFLIRNLSHEIKDNKWTTKIETYAVPKYMSVGDDRSILWGNGDNESSKTQSEQPEGAKEERVFPFDNYFDYTKFVYPVTATVSSPVGFRTDPSTKQRKFHYGTDLAASIGTPIYSACDGDVVQIGGTSFGTSAILIKIKPSCYKNQNQLPAYIWYGHNSVSYVKAGQPVTKGDLIGKVGNEGTSFGSHLHFEIFLGSNSGKKQILVDPSKYNLNRGNNTQASIPFFVKTVPGKPKQGGLD